MTDLSPHSDALPSLFILHGNAQPDRPSHVDALPDCPSHDDVSACRSKTATPCKELLPTLVPFALVAQGVNSKGDRAWTAQGVNSTRREQHKPFTDVESCRERRQIASTTTSDRVDSHGAENNQEMAKNADPIHEMDES